MSRLPRPNNVNSGFGTSTPTHIYGATNSKQKSDTVTVPSNFFDTSKLTTNKYKRKRNTNYNQMRKYHNLPSIRRLGRRRGSVAKRSATRSATGSVEGGKRTRKHNKKHKKTKKRRGKKRRTMRR